MGVAGMKWGCFRLRNGKNASYRYIGDFPQRMDVDFSYVAPVKIKCTATPDENLEVDYPQIKSIERRQLNLPLPPPTSPEQSK
jgi:hypothetical protein